MRLLTDLLRGDTVPSAVFVLSLVSALGLGLGRLRVGSVGLGSAGALFAGLARGRLGIRLAPDISQFVKEMGLILFVFTMGMQTESAAPLAVGVVVTVVPLLVVGVAARLARRIDYVRLCGLVAGSMSNPPALGFGNALLGGDVASTTYAAVYPLALLLRVVTAQMLALFGVGSG
jgi:putative transport protein